VVQPGQRDQVPGSEPVLLRSSCPSAGLLRHLEPDDVQAQRRQHDPRLHLRQEVYALEVAEPSLKVSDVNWLK
jgi:hypothetical protein